MALPVVCPVCKTGQLHKVDSSPTLSILTCDSCDKMISVKTSAGKVIEVLVPGVSILAGAIVIMAFFGIKNFNDLTDLLDL